MRSRNQIPMTVFKVCFILRIKFLDLSLTLASDFTGCDDVEEYISISRDLEGTLKVFITSERVDSPALQRL
jgi:hypothetical protein